MIMMIMTTSVLSAALQYDLEQEYHALMSGNHMAVAADVCDRAVGYSPEYHVGMTIWTLLPCCKVYLCIHAHTHAHTHGDTHACKCAHRNELQAAAGDSA